MTIRVDGFDHIVLRVRDLGASLAFYEDLLGLEAVGREEHASGLRPFISVRVGPQLVDLWPDETYDPILGAKAGGLFHFCVRVDNDLESEVVPALQSAGVEMLEESPAVRFGATGYGKSIYIRDPDGHMVELKESTTPQQRGPDDEELEG